MSNRPEFTQEQLDKALKYLDSKIRYRTRQKGCKHLASDFECFGLIHQEVMEYEKAIHERTHNWSRAEELLDIAWAALLGVVMHLEILEKNNDSPTSHLL